MTKAELSAEYDYRFEERLACLVGTDTPTAEAICLAIEEATEACAKLREQ